jgi:all-trans-retinol 13,14-reductase
VCKGVKLIAKHGVISDAGALNTFERLLPQDAAESQLNALKAAGALEPSFQLVYLFVGLDANDHDLNLTSTNYWITHGWDHDAMWDKFDKAKSFEDIGFLPMVFLSFGSAKDQEFSGNGNATLQLLAPARMEWFEKKEWEDTKVGRRGESYLQMKTEWRSRLLE